MEDNNLRDYVQWLIIDQCEKLLNMTKLDISILIGVSRPTLDRLMYDCSDFTIKHIEKLEQHLSFTKASLLISEAKDDSTPLLEQGGFND